MKHLKLFEDIYDDEMEYHMSEIKDLFQSVIDDYNMYDIDRGVFDPSSLKIGHSYYGLVASRIISASKIDKLSTYMRLIIVNRNDFNENLSLDIDSFIKRITSIGYKTEYDSGDIQERVFGGFQYKKSTGYYVDIVIDFSNLSTY